MPLTPVRDLLRHAEEHRYAVGYFEAWNLESLLAVKDAAVDGGAVENHSASEPLVLLQHFAIPAPIPRRTPPTPKTSD